MTKLKDQEKTRKPIAILISDVHVSIPALEPAIASLKQAISKAHDLSIPLIVAGDLHDTKANLRGECVNALIDVFSIMSIPCYILRGNHDALNEKSKEHSLNFLKPFANIVDEPNPHSEIGGGCSGKAIHLIPYHHDVEELRSYLRIAAPGATLIMHQGLKGTNSGDYIQDKSALEHDDVKDFRVISGHYHTRQDIKVGRPRKGAVGLFSYIGNPYTLNFAEAGDPEKGYQIMYDDGLLEFVPTNLRKHVVMKISGDKDGVKLVSKKYNDDDIIQVKLEGTKEWLSTVRKKNVADMIGVQNFRLDLIPLETTTERQEPQKETTKPELLDSIIDSTHNTSVEQKARIKKLWRNL